MESSGNNKSNQTKDSSTENAAVVTSENRIVPVPPRTSSKLVNISKIQEDNKVFMNKKSQELNPLTEDCSSEFPRLIVLNKSEKSFLDKQPEQILMECFKSSNKDTSEKPPEASKDYTTLEDYKNPLPPPPPPEISTIHLNIPSNRSSTVETEVINDDVPLPKVNYLSVNPIQLKLPPRLKSRSAKSVDRLLVDVTQSNQESEPSRLAQFPLSLSTYSLAKSEDAPDGAQVKSADETQRSPLNNGADAGPSTSSKIETAVETDGVASSFKTVIKPLGRDRAQERRNEALISALYYSKTTEEIQKILDKGANILTKCRDSGASVLHVAALNADPNAVELLISHGADIRARDKSGKQAIHVAAWEGALSVIQILCKECPEMVSSKVQAEDPFTNTCPDSWNHKHDQINKYWHVMESISQGSTPLHVACRRNKESCVKFLIESGAETLQEDSKGLYPVDVIGMNVNEDAINRESSNSSEGSVVGIAKLLIGHEKKSRDSSEIAERSAKGWPRIRRLFSIEDHSVRAVTALHTAVSDNNLNLITILLDEGADVLVWNEGGATPLHLAVRKKFLDALTLMLRHGDNRERHVVNAVDTQNRTLLHLAVTEEWNDGISILLEEDADITCKNNKRETVLHLAATANNVKILSELLTVPNVTTIINSVDDDCYAPIHRAVENNSLKCLELLVKNGAKAEVLLPDGRTLLHIVAKNNAVDLLEYLMDSTQLSVMKENKTGVKDGGMTALHVAASLGHNEIAGVLLKFGCDVGARTKDSTGYTPLHLAAKFDRCGVIKTLLSYDTQGTTLEATDSHGWYPLHTAAGHGHEECVDTLLRAGADVALTVQDEQGTKFTGLDIIMTCVHKPVDFLMKILDSYIIVDSKVPVTNPQCKIEVDFDFLLPNPSGSKQLGVLEAVLNNGSEVLEEAFFLHPIAQTFIYLKSKSMSFFFALFFDIFFLLAFYLSIIAYHGPFTLQQPLYRYILIGVLSLNILFEIINVARLQRYYLKDAETWIKWCVYVNILVIVIMPTDLVLRYNMAVCILLSWTELLLIIAKYPAWGIYVLMFATVAGTILKVLVVFSLLLIGFAFTFRALFQEKGPFGSVWSSLVKVIIMVYELDYRGTMEETLEEGPVFADIARLFYLMFVFMVSVSLVNLMIGLAVSDIAELKRKGRAKKLAKQVAFLGGLENLLYSWPLVSIRYLKKYREVEHGLVVKAGSKLGKTSDSPLPPKLKESIVEKARSVQQAASAVQVCAAVHPEDTANRANDASSLVFRKISTSSRLRLNMEV